MLPARSRGMLGMNRWFPSGLYVDAWSAAPIVPPVTGTWYQRTAAWVALEPATVCVFQSDSTPPMFEYWFCIMRRIGRVSRSLPPRTGTALGPAAQALPVDESVGPVKVELAGVAQSTWNFQTRTRVV